MEEPGPVADVLAFHDSMNAVSIHGDHSREPSGLKPRSVLAQKDPQPEFGFFYAPPYPRSFFFPPDLALLFRVVTAEFRKKSKEHSMIAGSLPGNRLNNFHLMIAIENFQAGSAMKLRH